MAFLVQCCLPNSLASFSVSYNFPISTTTHYHYPCLPGPILCSAPLLSIVVVVVVHSLPCLAFTSRSSESIRAGTPVGTEAEIMEEGWLLIQLSSIPCTWYRAGYADVISLATCLPIWNCTCRFCSGSSSVRSPLQLATSLKTLTFSWLDLYSSCFFPSSCFSFVTKYRLHCISTSPLLKPFELCCRL
jgi:hypothetical protein